MTANTQTRTVQLQVGTALEALHVMRPLLALGRESYESQRIVRLRSDVDGSSALECHTGEASMIFAMHAGLTGTVDVWLDAERLTAALESLGARTGPAAETVVEVDTTDSRRVSLTTSSAAERDLPVITPVGDLHLPPADASMVLDRKHFSRTVASAAVCAERRMTNDLFVYGVHLEDGTVTCTDRYRMAKHDVEAAAGTMRAVTLPAVALSQVLKRMGGDTIGMGHRFGCVTIRDGERVTYTQRVMDCDYPGVQRIIGGDVSERPQLDLDRKAILAVLKPYGTAGRHTVTLTPATDGVEATFRTWREKGETGSGEVVAIETIDRGPDSPEIPLEHEVTFNTGYLVQILRALEGKTVTLRAKGPLRPVHITSERAGRVFVLQPVRLG